MFTLHKHGISAIIKDRYATIDYLFHFEHPDSNEKHNNTNNSGKNNQLTFEFTIDPDAFMTNIECTMDDDTIYRSKITPKHDDYFQAPSANHADADADANADETDTISISQPYDKIPNVFKISANINATSATQHSHILLKISIEQYVQKHFNFNALHIHLLRNFNLYHIDTTCEDLSFTFDIMDENGIYGVDIASNAEDISKILVNSGKDIRIDKSDIDALKQKCTVHGAIVSDTLNVLTIKYKTIATSSTHVLFDTQSNTFCHTISLNAILNDEEDQDDEIDPEVRIPRRVVFVMDRSQRMQQGAKWNDVVSCTIGALEELSPEHDRYGIITYNQYIELLSSDGHMLVANDKNINESIRELQTNRNDMITDERNIHDALLLAIQLIKNDIQSYHIYMNQIIFITAGEANDGVIDPQQILFNIQYANDLTTIDRYCHKIAIFAFGIGDEGNDSQWIHDMEHPFLQILSVNNNGFYKRIRANNIVHELSEYLHVLRTPILSNVVIEYNEKNVYNLTNTNVNTWYAGTDWTICGKINAALYNNNDHAIHVRVTAVTGKLSKENGEWITKPLMVMKSIDLVMNPAAANDRERKAEDESHMERMWAYLQLRQFTDKRLVYDDMITMDIYEDEVHKYDVIALSLALKYTFMTPWTCMLMMDPQQQQDQAAQNGMYPVQHHHHGHNNALVQTQEAKQSQSRATITDIGDMHIIPHDYLDNLLETAVVHHRRKASQMQHVQTRLEEHLPNEIAATLAETLVSSVHPDADDDAYDENRTMHMKQEYGFVPMESQQRHHVMNRLEKRLSVRPSTKEIETKGVVPPQYFESPEASFMKRAVRRESAMNLLEDFLVNRQDIYQLTSRAIIYPDFIMNDHETALQQMDLRKQFVRDELNQKLNPKKRPSMMELSDKNIIPSHWIPLDIPSPLMEETDPYSSATQVDASALDALQREYAALRRDNETLTTEYNSLHETDTHHVASIEKLTLQIPMIEARHLEIQKLRRVQNSMELDRLDNKAIEIELAKERLNTQKLSEMNESLMQEISEKSDILQEMEAEIEALVTNKMQLISQSNAQINALRMYLRQYQKCVPPFVNHKLRQKVRFRMQDIGWRTSCNNNLQISNDGLMVSKVGKKHAKWDYGCACGNDVQFKNGDVIEWVLSINHLKKTGVSSMMVGVSSNGESAAGVQFGFGNLGTLYREYEEYDAEEQKEKELQLRFSVNDTVHLILDGAHHDNDWSLYAKIGGDALQNRDYDHNVYTCIYDKMDPASYRLSVALWSENDSLTIQSGTIYGFS